jgi:hypothetical protein
VSIVGIPYPNSQGTELKERMSYVKSLPRQDRSSGDAGQVLCTSLSSTYIVLSLKFCLDQNLAFRAVNQSIGTSHLPPILPFTHSFLLQVVRSATPTSGQPSSSSTLATLSLPSSRNCPNGSPRTSSTHPRSKISSSLLQLSLVLANWHRNPRITCN